MESGIERFVYFVCAGIACYYLLLVFASAYLFGLKCFRLVLLLFMSVLQGGGYRHSICSWEYPGFSKVHLGVD